ncbi:MAG TPA: glycosyltransferase family 4 protein [Blastocatellia bacterium]|nr:glycosyltransferase family 4 protein [Blastocatellia bacterium]
MTSPVLPLKSGTDSKAGETAPRRAALLLDLSNDRTRAIEWAERNIEGSEIRLINKADLKWESKRRAIERLRAIRPHTFAVFTQDLKAQSMRGALILFAAFAGARRILVGDSTGRTIVRSRRGAFLLEAPRLALELAAGYGVLVPLTWLITLLLSAAQAFKEPGRSQCRRCEPKTVLYIRATLSSETEGGMATHMSGFASGARALGHRLRFILSGRGGRDEDTRCFIEPSAAIGATRALYEIWNNLVFTARSLSLIRDRAGIVAGSDFIYQRYSRFNWTGVALSLVTGRRLLLEFNGSEVWVSKRWDPVGLLWLLERFERLNLKAADLVFVVSEVERRRLVAAGLDPERIIVNPNGVDAERFRPGCGGHEVRRAMGIEDKTAVGFLGTFGPWHGAPVLAEAIKLIGQDLDCHFLFIGDGDQRALTESIVESSGNSARVTFTGRIPHERTPAYLDACDIFVSPHVPSGDGTEFFGSPTKLFEYMAMARPVIASRLGQIADVIRSGENGILVEPGDSQAIAASIESLVKDDALRNELGSAARRTVVERFTWVHNAARVFDAADQAAEGVRNKPSRTRRVTEEKR